MGKKGGDLWNDSALVDAFNDAVSNYKKMNGKKGEACDPDENTFSTSSEENVSSCGAVREFESNTESELGENVKDSAHVIENPLEESEYNAYVTQGVQSSENTQHYNQLLTEYYDLETKRQNILQQLGQYGGWNYQYPTESSGRNNNSLHYYPVAEPVAGVNSYCQYICQPCTIAGCASSCGPCVGNTCTDTNVNIVTGNSRGAIDGDIVKTALGAAEKAISSMMLKSFVHSDSTGEKEEKKEANEQMAKELSSETDLSVVLNAWYSAGFHTGK
ncbi:hypothetical protein ACFE04_008544 [Oxalis oulophora]